jgi:acyl-CoA synthetase (AMP-forming)/AMP-acid ligase II
MCMAFFSAFTSRASLFAIGYANAYAFQFPRSFIDEPPRDILTLPAFDLSGEDNRKHPCLILFSSGTTGFPKAVLLSHHNLIAHLMSARTSDARLNGCSSREVFFAPCKCLYIHLAT